MYTSPKLSEFLEEQDLPILFSEGRQLQVEKDGELVNSYDPVFDIQIEEGELRIEGFMNHFYTHRLEDFDNLTVEERV